MKYQEIKDLDFKELLTLLSKKREELRGLRFKAANRQLGNVKSIKKVRQEIARIMTALKEQEKSKTKKD